jgi:hypothetical protein
MIGVTLLQRGFICFKIPILTFFRLFAAVDSLVLDCGPWLALHLDIEVFRAAAMVEEKIRMGIA